MIKVFTTTQPDAENFELRTNNAGNIITNVETVGPDFVADAYAESLAVNDWYLDGVTGNDASDGKTLATALKTAAELQRRLGPQAAWNHNVTIHVGVGGVPDALNIVGDTLAQDVHVDIIGTVTSSVDAGLVTSYSAIDHVTPRSPTIACANITDWTPHVGKRLRITSGPNAGALNWVLKANPHGLGLNVARTGGRWYRRVEGPSETTLFVAVTPTTADPVVIETLPFVQSVTLKLGGAVDATTSQNPWIHRQYSIQNIEMQNGVRDCSGDFIFYRGLVFGCKMQSFTSVNGNSAISNASPSCCECFLLGPTTGVGFANGVWVGCAFMAYPGTQFTLGNNLAQPGRFYYCVGQYVSFAPTGPDFYDNCQVWDTPTGYGAFASRGLGTNFNNCSSADNAQYGLLLENGTATRLRGTINISGAVANVRLTNTPTVNFPLTVTTANVASPDFAWSGTATLVAGTATVVVPYVDWTLQKVTFSRANSLGTIGDLSVPTATRTATGFTINSSNIADISTVDWQISALGRGVNITKN